MKNFLAKNKTATIITIFTVILAAVAIYTGIRLFQLRGLSIAPNAPESQPAAADNCGHTCSSNNDCTGGTVCRSNTGRCVNPFCNQYPTACDSSRCNAFIPICGEVGCAIAGSKCGEGFGVCDTSSNKAGVCNCNLTPSPVPTVPPSPTPFPAELCDLSYTITSAPQVQCTEVLVYDTNWVRITNFSTVFAGTTVRFAAKGTTTNGTIDKARFSINGGAFQETTVKKPGTEEFYIEYTFPSGSTSFQIHADLHHLETNTWF